MNSRFRHPRAVRGAVAPSRLIALLVVLVLIGAGAWWFFLRAPATVGPKPAANAPASGAAASNQPAAPTATVPEDLTVDQLYREARKAMNENRIAAPAGNNALEFYLKILAKQPDDSGPKDALRELFPFATGAAEDQINQGNFDEANRIIGLLAEADPSNYSLTILRSKLDARKKQADREQQQAQAAAAAAAAKQAATSSGATTAPAETASATTGAPAAGETTAPATAPPAAAPPATETASVAKPRPAAPPTPAPAPQPKGETRDAIPISPAVPEYPIAAARNRQEGWVEVEFTVAADGSVQNAHVVASNPTRVFDREAVAAVEKAKYEPRLENGQPVASTLRRRIEFKLRR